MIYINLETSFPSTVVGEDSYSVAIEENLSLKDYLGKEKEPNVEGCWYILDTECTDKTTDFVNFLNTFFSDHQSYDKVHGEYIKEYKLRGCESKIYIVNESGYTSLITKDFNMIGNLFRWYKVKLKQF